MLRRGYRLEIVNRWGKTLSYAHGPRSAEWAFKELQKPLGPVEPQKPEWMRRRKLAEGRV